MHILKIILLISLFFATNIKSYANCSNEFAYLVIRDDTGEILEQKRSEELKHPASLTKLMTLYLTFEALNYGIISMDSEIVMSDRSANQWKFNADLQEGDIITVREAILGVIVKSYNDFAVALAEKVGGNEWKFVAQMNKKAKELGMENTNFRNATGFSDNNQFTTAYDIALLVKALKRDFPEYYPLFSTKEFIFRDKVVETHNHVVKDYQWAEGMKTGFTRASGYNIVTTAKMKNVPLTTVVISCESISSRDNFVVELLDKNFDKLIKKDVFIASSNKK